MVGFCSNFGSPVKSAELFCLNYNQGHSVRLGWIWGTLFACFSLQSQAIVKEYTYDDGDRIYTSESSSASWVYQHDAAGNRLSELRYKGNAPGSHKDIQLDAQSIHLTNVDPNSTTQMTWNITGADANQVWSYNVCLYSGDQLIQCFKGLSEPSFILPLLESGKEYRIAITGVNGQGEEVALLEEAFSTSNTAPSEVSLTYAVTAKGAFEFEFDSKENDVLDKTKYTLQESPNGQDQWQELYSGFDKQFVKQDPRLSGTFKTYFKVSATDQKSAPVWSPVINLEQELIDFEDEALKGFHFWPSDSDSGSYLKMATPDQQWFRHQRDDGNWVYRGEHKTTNALSYTRMATFVMSTGGRLKLNFRKSQSATFWVYANGNQLYYTSGNTGVADTESLSLPIPEGPTTVVLIVGGDDAWAEVDDLLLTGPSDNDADGLSDGFEMAYYHSLTAHDYETVKNLDSDGDGILDLKELELNADINSADSDGDGLPDAWEHQHGLSLTTANGDEDSDQDGVSNMEEWIQGTDPSKADGAQNLEITFEDEALKGFHFWPSDSDSGRYLKEATPNQRWFRHQREGGNWVYRGEHKTTNALSYTRMATFVVSKGGQLKLNFRKSQSATFWVYANGSQLYYTSGNTGVADAESLSLPMPEGPTTVVLIVGGDDAWAEVDDLLLTGPSDSDADGLGDAFEKNAYNNLTAQDANSSRGLDTDGDGRTDFDEHQSHTDPLSAEQ